MSIYKIRDRFLVKRGGTRINANENYSGAVQIYEAVVPAGEVWNIARITGMIGDGGQMSPNEYGDLGVALSNGIEVMLAESDDDVINTLTDTLPVKTNAQWAAHCYDSTNLGSGVAGADAYAFRWTFGNAHKGQGGTFRPLRLIAGQKFQISFNDDLSSLTDHYFKIGVLAE